jgi:exodeoxyribonuclease VII small subunit
LSVFAIFLFWNVLYSNSSRQTSFHSFRIQLIVTTTQPQPEPPSFEEAYEKLESLVEALEDGSIPLRQMVEDYEKATQLLRICQERLKDAETRIDILRNNGNSQTAEPFQLDASSD